MALQCSNFNKVEVLDSCSIGKVTEPFGGTIAISVVDDVVEKSIVLADHIKSGDTFVDDVLG